MAGKEAWPNGPEAIDADVEAYLGRSMLHAEVRGEQQAFEHPGNFPWVFEAYEHIRAMRENGSAKETKDNRVLTLVQYLQTDPNGQITVAALDQFTMDEQNWPTIRQAKMHKRDEVRSYFYSQIIDGTRAFLPPDLDAEILRDPRAYAIGA